MSCPICSGCTFVSTDEPFRILPCYHCGTKTMFIHPGDEERFIRDVIQQRSQTKLDFPEQDKK